MVGLMARRSGGAARWSGPGRPWSRSTAGQSLVEMALVLPILLALLVGIVELGRAWNIRQVIVNAAREGARVAVIPLNGEDDARAEIESRLRDAALDPADATIEIEGISGITGTPTTVRIAYPYEFLFLGPVVDLLGGDDGGVPGAITMRTTATMRNE